MIAARTKPGRGFTLVELLVVITIIGLLVAIMVPAVSIVLYNTKNARIAMEISSLAQAIEAYKVDAGDYPPNFNDWQRVKRHVLKRWSQLPPAQLEAFKSMCSGGFGTETPPSNPVPIDPAESLVFWLGGSSPNGRLMANDVMPFNGAGEPKVYFEFDEGRLSDPDGNQWRRYASPYGNGAPYVYFDARSYVGFYSAGYDASTTENAYGVARPAPSSKAASPYDVQQKFVNPTTFQIIAAGQDGNFGGEGAAFPDGPYTIDGDKDNIANFTEGKTFEDARP